MRVLAWSEGSEANELYPRGIRAAVADALSEMQVRTACMDDPDQGVDLSDVDVLVWWGHARHAELHDQRADEIAAAVRERGMGLLVLHSGHHSKPFKRALGCSGDLAGWREAAEVERLWIVDPSHPVAQGLPNPIVIEHEEMYAEPFAVPPPDDLVFISSFAGGEAFRSGAGWRIGQGRVFYFRPGHETYPTLYVPAVKRILQNAVRWCGQAL
jgi:trehalose utilization protein